MSDARDRRGTNISSRGISTPRRRVTSRHVTLCRVNSCQRHTRPASFLQHSSSSAPSSLTKCANQDPGHSWKHFPHDSNSHRRTCSPRTPHPRPRIYSRQTFEQTTDTMRWNHQWISNSRVWKIFSLFHFLLRKSYSTRPPSCWKNWNADRGVILTNQISRISNKNMKMVVIKFISGKVL